MRRWISSLLVAVLVLTLAVRAVAAPFLHSHDGAGGSIPGAALHSVASEDIDIPCHAPERAESVDHGSGNDHNAASDQGKPPVAGTKICDASGACCGSLAVLMGGMTPDSPMASEQPAVLPSFAGLGPASLDRPPSPPIA